MTQAPWKRFALTFTTALLFASGHARAAGYTYTKIVVPGAVGTQAYGINDTGVVAGSYYVNQTIGGLEYAIFHGFVFDHGTFTTIDVPGAAATNVTGVGNDGTVVGYYSPVMFEGQQNAFILKNGIYQTFGKPGYVTQLTSVSHDGAYAVAVSQSYGGRYFQISTAHNGVPGHIVLKGSSGYTYGINDSGVAVGQIGPLINQAAVVIPQDTVSGKPLRPRPLPFPFRAGASVDGINDGNTVVGTFFDTSSGLVLGYTGAGSAITRLAYPGAVATRADAINDAGDVLGTAALDSGTVVYVLHQGTYTPLPGIPTMSFVFGVVAINAGGQVLANTGSVIYVATPQ